MFNSSGERLHIHNIEPEAVQPKERVKSSLCTLQGQCVKANDGDERVFQF